MTTPMDKKAKLKAALMEILDPEEKVSLSQEERISNIEQKVNLAIKNIKDSNETTVELIGKLVEAIASKSDDGGWNINAAPLFRQLISEVSSVKDHTKKSVEVQSKWRFPQYSSVSVRNKNFSNINPATDAFGIGDYDQIDLTYSGSNISTVTYKLNGSAVATLTLSYSGSNITSVVKS